MGETPFVVQRHTKQGRVHFDVMVQRGESLATWSFPELPWQEEVAGKRNFDHRLKYLTFEGELGGIRGATTIVDRGTCEILEWDDKHLEVVFKGSLLAGRYMLVRGSAQTWTLSRAPEAGGG